MKKISIVLIILSAVFINSIFAEEKSISAKYNSYSKAAENPSTFLYECLKSESNRFDFCINFFRMTSNLKDISEIDLMKQKVKFLLNNSTLKDNLFVKNVMKNYLLNIELTNGNLENAEKLKKELGWVENYKLIGPFNYNSIESFNSKSFEIINSKSEIKNEDDVLLDWFNVRSDRQGLINTDDLFEKQNKKYFLATASFNIKKPKKIKMFLARTGPVKVIVGDKVVFFEESRARTYFSQHVIELDLDSGSYPVYIQFTGNGFESEIGLQIFEENGNVVQTSSRNDFKRYNGKVNSFKILPGYFNQINENISSDEQLFKTAEMLYFTGFNIENKHALSYFNKINSKSEFYSLSRMLAADCESSSEKQDYLLNQAIESDSKNIAAKLKLVSLKMEHNNFYEADRILRELENKCPNNDYVILSRCDFYIRKGWDKKALEQMELFEKNEYVYRKLECHLRMYKSVSNVAETIKTYFKLISMNAYDSSLVKNQINYLMRVSSNDDLIAKVFNFSQIFYNDLYFQHLLSDSMYFNENINKSFAVLSAAYLKCPYNSLTNYRLFLMHDYLKNDQAAQYYLKRAKILNPSGKYFARYYEVKYHDESVLSEYSSEFDIYELSKKADEYKNEPAVTLLDERIHKIEHDGSIVKKIRKVYKIFDSNNVKSLTPLYFVIDPDEDDIVSINCTLYDGKEQTIINDVSYQYLSSPESRLYYNQIAVISPLPYLNDGTIIEYEYIVHSKKSPEYKGYFNTYNVFNNSYRILKIDNKTIMPNNMICSYKMKNIDKNKLKIQKNNGQKIYYYSDNNIEPFTKEPQMLPGVQIYPTLMFSSFSNWEQFQQWYIDLIKDQSILTAAMKQEIDKLVSKNMSEDEIIEKVYSYITNRTRYVGFELGIGGIKPRKTDETFQTKLGDCKDIALLLSVIYKYLGFESKLALVRTSDKGLLINDFAFIGNFNHAICYIKSKKNGDIFLDGTAKQTGSKEIPNMDVNTTALLVDENGFEFKKIQNNYYYINMSSYSDTIKLSGQGDAIINKSVKKTGQSAVSVRNIQNSNTNYENRLKRNWKNTFPSSNMYDFKFKNYEINKPVEYSYSLQLPSFGNVIGDEIIIPAVYDKYELYNYYALTSKRNTVLYISEHRKIINEFNIEIPEAYEAVDIPKSISTSFKSCYIKFDSSLDKNNHILKIRYEIFMDRLSISQKDYPEFRKFILTSAVIESLYISLKKVNK